LAALDFDTRVLGVPGLFARQVPVVLSSTISAAGGDDDFELFPPGSAEFNILALSVKCPWHVVQQSSSLLTAVVRFTLRSVMKCTSHRLGKVSIGAMTITDVAGNSGGGGSEPIDDVAACMMGYSDLLLSALRPPTSSSDVYQNFLTQSSDPAVFCDPSRAIDIDLKRELYSVFVLNGQWANSTALQARRLDILELLFDGEDEDATIRSILNGKIATLFQTVFSSTSLASTPVHVRRASAYLVKRVVTACCDENTRVVPYTKRPDIAATESGDVPLLLNDVVNSTAVLKLLMNVALDDSCDDIRVMTLETVLYVVPFVLRSGDKEFTKRNLISADDASASVAAAYTYEGIVDRLIHRVVDGNPTQHFLEVVDTVLRSLAVLCPAEFEGIVRSNFKLLAGVHEAPSAASELFSGLIDHCEMMVQFSSK
jgi:hypothetical protein